MKILFCGDIVGRSGREAVIEHVPALRRQLGLDFVIVNGENAAHGFGLTGKICDELFAAGVDVITGGNHSWDKSEIIPLMDQDTRLLRPANFPPATPGRGAFVYTDGAGRRIKVINVMTRLFMELLDDPFPAIQARSLWIFTVRRRARRWRWRMCATGTRPLSWARIRMYRLQIRISSLAGRVIRPMRECAAITILSSGWRSRGRSIISCGNCRVSG